MNSQILFIRELKALFSLSNFFESHTLENSLLESQDRGHLLIGSKIQRSVYGEEPFKFW